MLTFMWVLNSSNNTLVWSPYNLGNVEIGRTCYTWLQEITNQSPNSIKGR